MIELLSFAFTFFKIGAFTFGGGYAMIPLIISELTGQGLVTAAEVADIIAIAQVTPGTFAINAATFSGVKTFGLVGGLVGTAGVMLPSVIMASLAAKFYMRFRQNRVLKNTMATMRAVVMGLIAGAVVTLLPAAVTVFGAFDYSSALSFFKSFDAIAVIIAVAAGVAVIKFKASPIVVVVASGVVGILAYAVF